MQRPSSGWFLDLNGVCSDPRGPSVEVPSHPAVTTKACQLKTQGSRQEMATPPRRLFGRRGSARHANRHAKARYITYYVIFLSAGATVNWTKLTNYTPDDQEERVDPSPSPAVFRHFRRVCLCFGLFPLISPGFRNKEKHVKTFPKNRKNFSVTRRKRPSCRENTGVGKPRPPRIDL